MAGNVWEWCLNEYGNPNNVGLGGEANRVLRGGSWYDDQDFARCASRDDFSPYSRGNYYGFRVCVGGAPIRSGRRVSDLWKRA
jgi:formylglycine-generating enzyme required for sulfatase activity